MKVELMPQPKLTPPCKKCGHDIDDHDWNEDFSYCVGGHINNEGTCVCKQYVAPDTVGCGSLLVQ